MAEWKNVGKIQGEKGEKGDKGEKGEKGDSFEPYTENWTNFELVNGWENQGGSFAEASFKKDPFGRVYLRGVIKGGQTGYIECANLPIGYRPKFTEIFGTAQSTSIENVRIHIYTTGDIQIISSIPENRYLTLSGISFDTL